MASYDDPLDATRLAREQGLERAKLCDRLETMWQGLQADIEDQRQNSERGVDPRLQQLQLQTVKMIASLWRMTAAPLPEPEEEPDPEVAARNARAAAEAALERVVERLGQQKETPEA